MGGESKQVMTRLGRVRQFCFQVGGVDSHVWQCDRDVSHLCATGMGKFADPIDRVMVVESQHVTPIGEGVALTDEFERSAGVGRENGEIFVRVGIEEFVDLLARPLHEVGGGNGSGVGGVRVAEDILLK